MGFLKFNGVFMLLTIFSWLFFMMIAFVFILLGVISFSWEWLTGVEQQQKTRLRKWLRD